MHRVNLIHISHHRYALNYIYTSHRTWDLPGPLSSVPVVYTCETNNQIFYVEDESDTVIAPLWHVESLLQIL